jgi:chemotaxis protein MotD
MSAAVVPSQGAAQFAAQSAAMAISGDRHSADQSGDPDSSAFGAVLDSFDGGGANPPAANGSVGADGATQTAASPPQPTESASTPISARSISSVHYLASGALVALDKRLNAQDPSAKAGASDSEAAGSSSTKIDWASLISGDKRPATAPARTDSKDDRSVDATALTSIGWASLIQGATAPEPVARSSPGDGSVPGRNLPVAPAQIASPSDPTLALSTANVALHGGPAAVDVKVVRSITYLGLDPIVQDAKLNQPAAAKARAAQTTSVEAGLAAASSEADTAAAAPGSSGGPAMGSGGDSSGHPMGHAGAKGYSSAKVGPSPNVEGASGAEANNSATTSIVARVDAAAMLSATGALSTPIGQLADLIGNAASGMAAGGQDAASAVKAAGAAGVANMAPIKELDVQLSPANLGSLSIQMRLTNGNLNITIKADKSDTVRLIDSERSSISDKLKSLNFSVETLTIKASDAASSNSAGGDSNHSGTSDYGQAQQGQSGRNGEGSPNGRSLQDGGDQARPARQGRDTIGEPGRDNLPGHRFV